MDLLWLPFTTGAKSTFGENSLKRLAYFLSIFRVSRTYQTTAPVLSSESFPWDRRLTESFWFKTSQEKNCHYSTWQPWHTFAKSCCTEPISEIGRVKLGRYLGEGHHIAAQIWPAIYRLFITFVGAAQCLKALLRHLKLNPEVSFKSPRKQLQQQN